MPALKCGTKHCGFSSDDLVIVLLLAAVLRFLMFCGALAMAVFIYIALGDCQPTPYALLIFYIFGTLLLQLLVLTVEWCMFIVSKTGGIMQMHMRQSLVGWLVIRFVLVLVEAAMSVVGGVTAWSDTTLNEHCTRTAVHACIVAFTVVTWVAVAVACMCFGVLLDPFSCYSPATITHVEEDPTAEDANSDISKGEGYIVKKVKRSVRHFGAKKEYVVNESDKKLYNPKMKHLWQKSLNKVKCSCCKQEGHDHQSTMESIAQDLAILFDEDQKGYVVSDLVAALVLTMEEQQPYYDCLTRSLRKNTIKQMDDNQFVRGKEFYKYHHPMSPNETDVQALKDAMYFYPYSMGVYGWPMYCFDRPLIACCHLACKIGPLCGCGACHPRERNYTFGHIAQDPCGCNTAALALTVGLSKRDIVYVSCHNELFKAPFAVLLDRDRRTVVIAIRGTMSLSDVLTDLSISLDHLEIKEAPYNQLDTHVHKGMLKTANHILEEIEEHNVLSNIESEHPECCDFSITVVGHSLGAGVASVLALKLKTDERLKAMCAKDVKCYVYEPPGCVFSYPLAEYSKSFITSIVLNNDLVPSLNWRSLLLLKHSMMKHLHRSTDPKYQILYRGVAPRCARIPSLSDDTSQHDQLVDEVFDKPDCLDDLGKLRQKPMKTFRQAADVVLFATRWRMKGTHQSRRKVSHGTCEEISAVSPVPTFVPGRVLHVQEFKEPSCCPGFTKTHYRVSCKANEDFGVLRLGEKALDSHLPNSLSAAFKVLGHQMKHGHDFTMDYIPTRPDSPDCPEAGLLNTLFNPPQPTTQAPRRENPQQAALVLLRGVQRHSRATASYELAPQNGGTNHSLHVVAEVPEQSSDAESPITYV